MIDFKLNTKYEIDFTSDFKKQLKKVVKKGKDIEESLKHLYLLRVIQSYLENRINLGSF